MTAFFRVSRQRKAEMEFGRNSADYNKVLENWNTYFWVRCREGYSFFYLAYDSLHCAEEMIESIHTETEPVCSLERWPSVSSAPMSRST